MIPDFKALGIFSTITLPNPVKPKNKIKYKIKNIDNLEKITQIFFSGKRKMINKPFSKIFKNYEEVATSLNIDLKKRPSELSYENYYQITEKYEKIIS